MKRLCKGLHSTESEAEAQTNADKHQRRATDTGATGAPSATATNDGAQSVMAGDAAHTRTVTSAALRSTVQTHQPEMIGILPNGTSPNQALYPKFSGTVLNTMGQRSAVQHGLSPKRRVSRSLAVTQLTRHSSRPPPARRTLQRPGRTRQKLQKAQRRNLKAQPLHARPRSRSSQTKNHRPTSAQQAQQLMPPKHC
jgi:hypothetical protein